MLKKIGNGFLAIAITFTLISGLNVNAQTTNAMNKVTEVAQNNNLNRNLNNPNNNPNNLNNNINDTVDNRGNDWAWLGLLGLVGLLGLRKRPERR